VSDDVTALPRETGSDKSHSTCPGCGADLPAVTTATGSVTAGRCPKCTGDGLAEAEKALEQGNQERGYPLGIPDESWKVDQLTAYADAAGVDLSGAKGSKASILEAIGSNRA
jgi:Zn-finger nucleic acid-binding protein